jgi:hypothetical protein
VEGNRSVHSNKCVCSFTTFAGNIVARNPQGRHDLLVAYPLFHEAVSTAEVW